MLVRPTNDRALLERGVLALNARGETALYDALITAMLQFQVSGSRRALVVFSDGVDIASLFSGSDVAEVARRSGVPIYVLALSPDITGALLPREQSIVMVPDPYTRVVEGQRELKRLSESTGGKAFRMKSLDQLGSIWKAIGEDLRKQALVIYRTTTKGNEWRPLEVTLRDRAVRAPSGVYVTSTSE
jgi:VWFA-related protein